MTSYDTTDHILWPHKRREPKVMTCGKCGEEVYEWVYDNNPKTDYGILCLGCVREIKHLKEQE